jgi:hypothetical protein
VEKSWDDKVEVGEGRGEPGKKRFPEKLNSPSRSSRPEDSVTPAEADDGSPITTLTNSFESLRFTGVSPAKKPE